jgi:hypothetical protein
MCREDGHQWRDKLCEMNQMVLLVTSIDFISTVSIFLKSSCEDTQIVYNS